MINTSTQLKALIRNISKEKGINAQTLLNNYLLERLLERIAISKYKGSFILKGGMLIAAMVGVDARSTVDIDATIKGKDVNEDNISNILNEILLLDIDDNVKMSLIDIEEIRNEAEYPGFRASIQAEFDGIKNTLKLDMTTGDKIVPREIEYKYKLMLEDRYLNVLAYNIETVLAEKLETILARSIANTRMRDFYDVYIILTMYKDLVDFDLLNTAIKKVCENRETLNSLKDKRIILDEISENKNLQKLWDTYTKKYNYAKDISWQSVMEILDSI